MTMLISPSTAQINRYPVLKSDERPPLQNNAKMQDSVHFEGRGERTAGGLKKTVSGVRKVDPDTKKRIPGSGSEKLTRAQIHARSNKKRQRLAEFLKNPDHLTQTPRIPTESKGIDRDGRQIVKDNKDFIKPEHRAAYDRITGSPSPEPETSSSSQQIQQTLPPVTQHQPLPSMQLPNHFPQQYFPTQAPALPQPEFVTHIVPDQRWPNHYRNIYSSGRMSPNPRTYIQPQMPAYSPFQGGHNQQL